MIIKINGKNYKAEKGETIYQVAKKNGIKIPVLCSMKNNHEGICRICMVEADGKLVTSCNAKVTEGMEIITESKNIEKSRRINMEILWSDHAGKCATCKKNQRCKLQKLAEEYKIENFHFVPRRGEMTSGEENDLIRENWSRVVVENENPVIARTTEYCIECRRCINICPIQSYGFYHRAGDVVVGTPYEETLDCLFCGACIKHCPTAALTDQGNLEEIQQKLEDLNILAIAIVDPAIFKSVAFEFETENKEKILGIIKALGFEKIFSLNWGFEKYFRKLVEELKSRSIDNILFNNHCPAFSRYVKIFFPEFIKNLAKIPIPDEILAQDLKTEYAKREKIDSKNICIVSISACTAKKAEQYEFLDAIITVRELGKLAREKGIASSKVKEAVFDEIESGDFKLAEKMLESGGSVEMILEKIGKNIKTAKANGIPEAKKVLESIRKKKEKYDYVEVMVCPEGCISGGGQAVKI